METYFLILHAIHSIITIRIRENFRCGGKGKAVLAPVAFAL